MKDKDLIEKLLEGFNQITSSSTYDDAYDIACEMLELESKPRTKTEFVKVEYSTSWQAAKDHEERVEFLYRQSDLGDAIKGNNWKAIQSPSEAARYHFDLYRKVEVEIDERQEFIEAAKEIIDGSKTAEYSLGAMFDSGRFKLVE